MNLLATSGSKEETPMKLPGDFYRPLAIGAPAPVHQLPVVPERMRICCKVCRGLAAWNIRTASAALCETQWASEVLN